MFHMLPVLRLVSIKGFPHSPVCDTDDDSFQSFGLRFLIRMSIHCTLDFVVQRSSNI